MPSRFEVCAAAVVVRDLDKPAQMRSVQMRPARIVALLPEAAQNVLRGRDWNARGAGPGCFAVTTNEARSLAKALDGAGPADARKGGSISLHYHSMPQARTARSGSASTPFLPHGEVTLLGGADEEPSSSERSTHESSSGSPRRARGGGHADIGCGGGA